MNLREKFDTALKLNKETGCLEWQRSLNIGGYGQLYSGANDRPMMAHRFAWTRVNGPIPDGLFVCHKCDNPKCCNVEHLFLGTLAENNQDANRKGRLKWPRTQRHEQHHRAKLSVEQVQRLRAEASTSSQRALAKKYGMSQPAIGAAIRGETWAVCERRKRIPRRPKVSENFSLYYQPLENGCWEWQAGKTVGYGCLSVNGKTMYAHRFAWERNGGSVPEGFFLQHACANKLCVNPEHLRLLPKAGTK